VAVLIDVYEYEAIQERLELLTDVQISLNQIENDKELNMRVQNRRL
jgi:antitoxin YefM